MALPIVFHCFGFTCPDCQTTEMGFTTQEEVLE